MNEWRELAGVLRNRHQGPILVIGGGPTVPGSINALRGMAVTFETVVSANEHGFKAKWYRPEYAVCLDAVHGITRTPMQKLLGQHGAKIVTPCWFGDYRLASFKGNMNTGLVAVYVGLLMGGRPVVPIGIDFYRMVDDEAACYFHDPDGKSNSLTKAPANFENQIRAFLERIGGTDAPVRPLCGPLTRHFPRFDPTEDVRHWKGSRYTEWLTDLETIQVENGRKPAGFAHGTLPPGYVCPMGDREALGFLAACQSRVVHPLDHALAKFDRLNQGVHPAVPDPPTD